MFWGLKFLVSVLIIIVNSQGKSRTWRNSSRLWEESNNTCQKLKKSSLKTTRRPTPPSSSWEPQSIFLLLKLMTRRKLRKSWTLSQPVSHNYHYFTHLQLYYRPQEGATQVSTVHGSVTNERTIICVLRKTTLRVTTALNHTHTSESEGYPSLRSRSFFSPSSLLDLSCGLVPSDFPSVVF